MTRYYTRIKRRRQYSWLGIPLNKDRKVQNVQYGGLSIKSDASEEVTVTPGDFVLIEGDDEERPFVAKLKELYDDGSTSGSNKHATVQWFLHYEEVPYRKRKMLGREPDPREIFLYDVACENDIDAETIIGTVQVSQLKVEEPFPTQKSPVPVLFFKLSWDGKAFRALTSSICMGDEKQNGINVPISLKSMPMPQFYPLEGDVAETRQITQSSSKPQRNETAVESVHSASKSSHSKDRRAQRASSTSSTPGARKKLQLNSPTKSSNAKPIHLDVLIDDNELKVREPTAPKRKVAFSGLPDSPPKRALSEDTSKIIIPLKTNQEGQKLSLSVRLTPLKHALNEEQGADKVMGTDVDGITRITRSKTPQKVLSTQEKYLPQLSKRLGEQKDNDTPRSQRKSARESSLRIRKQLNEMANRDGEDHDEDDDLFSIEDQCVLVSSGESEEEEKEETTSPKRSRTRRTVPRTPTSSRKTPARTPNKTPVSRTPHSATPRIPERNQPVQTPANVLEEARIRLGEQKDNDTPQTPRSQRKSACESSLRIRKQLNEMANRDGEDHDEDDDFVPIEDKRVLISSGESEEEEEEVEEEKEETTSPKRSRTRITVPRTPTSSRKTPARTPNKTPVSRTPHSATPRIPERNQPVQTPANVLEEARIRLHVSAVPESLPCREQEFQDVYSFVESKLMDGTGGCMYISGVPGTGKTATVHEVIRCLQRAVEEEETLRPFQFIEINGMKLTDPHQAFVQILKLLTGQKATAEHAAALLEKRFSTSASKRETTVLLVDELDLLWTRKQNVMYSLFDWPTRKQAKLIVLAIANTMDLPERIMMNRVASRLGLTRMSFQPYTHKQLQQIITSRLNHVKAFDDDAIQLVSRKVAALSGDARRCLDICRRATEICEFSCKKEKSSIVRMPHVMEALDEMFSSPYVIAIRSSSVMEQTFLRAVIAEFRRSGLEEATFQKVYYQNIALCRIEGMQPPSMSETMAVCLRLGAYRLLLVESSKNDLHMRVRINVSQDDIMYALKEE
ncbi:origin recognition complex subunit 1 [Pelobates fuscus]|uniref:origin recognition complex subunit 1 n=1 Tax=Pelobates fuscus TaxID=191477 RepID=UPI002FE46949